jgi:c-di-GMP-related signal transduction protein
MELARVEGCTLFQGYFFSKPVVVSQRRIPQNQIVYIQLLSALSAERPDLFEIERLFKGDSSLCYLLLRLANSALLSTAAPASTIHDALMRLGETEARKLVTTSFAGMFANTHSEALIRMMLERARLCELLSPMIQESPAKLYLLGMLSLLDTLMQVDMTEVLKSIPLDADMTAALTGQPSRMGVALDLVRCFESGNWSDCRMGFENLALTENQLIASYAESVQWAGSVLSNVS